MWLKVSKEPIYTWPPKSGATSIRKSNTNLFEITGTLITATSGRWASSCSSYTTAFITSTGVFSSPTWMTSIGRRATRANLWKNWANITKKLSKSKKELNTIAYFLTSGLISPKRTWGGWNVYSNSFASCSSLILSGDAVLWHSTIKLRKRDKPSSLASPIHP